MDKYKCRRLNASWKDSRKVEHHEHDATSNYTSRQRSMSLCPALFGRLRSSDETRRCSYARLERSFYTSGAVVNENFASLVLNKAFHGSDRIRVTDPTRQLSITA